MNQLWSFPSMQRVALSTAANICRQLPSDSVELIKDAIPILTNLLQYQDEKVRGPVFVQLDCLLDTNFDLSYSASGNLRREMIQFVRQHGMRHDGMFVVLLALAGAGFVLCRGCLPYLLNRVSCVSVLTGGGTRMRVPLSHR
jgi:hypothetical protein